MKHYSYSPDGLASYRTSRRRGAEIKRGWTDAEMLAAIDAGTPREEILTRFQCDVKLLLKIADENGREIRRQIPTVSIERDEQILALVRQGASWKSAATALGVTKNVVSGAIERMKARGVDVPERPTKKTTDAEETEILRLWSNGMRYRAIGRKFGFSIDVVRRVVVQAKKEPLPSLIDMMEAVPVQKPLPVALVPVVTRWLHQPIAPARTCQWPLWEEGEKPKFKPDWTPLMCDAPSVRGSYCACHASVAYVKARPMSMECAA